MAKASPSKNVYYDKRLINLLRYWNDINRKCVDVVTEILRVLVSGFKNPTDVIGQSVCLTAQKKLCKGEYGILFCIIA